MEAVPISPSSHRPITPSSHTQDTIEAVLIIPFSSAARNATSTLLLFKLLGLSQAYLAALLVLVFTLFPLTYPWVVTIPWVLAHMLSGHWGRGSCLFAGMLCCSRTRTHTRTHTHTRTRTHMHMTHMACT